MEDKELKKIDDSLSYADAYEEYKRLVSLYLKFDRHHDHLYYKIEVLKGYLNTFNIAAIRDDVMFMEVHLNLILGSLLPKDE